MRTNIEIDDTLMRKAMASIGAPTKKAAVEAALELMIRIKAQGGVRKLRGKIQWEGDLAGSREGRSLNHGSRDVR
jgi:Arc/MetJ family transcription regulator